MANHEFGDIKACVFDAYGTLFDVHSAVGRHRSRVGEMADAVSGTWRGKQLEYTWLRSLMGCHADFWQVTAEALDYALEAHDIDDSALREDLLQAYLRLDAYPEVPGVLERLKRAGYHTAILSNGEPEMLRAGAASAGIEGLLDAILSVESVGIYKPDPRVYQLSCDHFGISPEQVSFQSSNAWDAVGASAFGYKVAWCNRFGQQRERLPAQPHAVIGDLNRLLDLLGIDPG